MGQSNKKKVEKKKIFGFTKPMLEQLTLKVSSGFGEDETDVLRRLLMGEQQFSPSVERYLADLTKRTGISRAEIIERLVTEALALRDARFRL